MAYFERADERDQLVFCNICDVKCAERSIIVHKGKCSDRHAKKFQSGDLIKCQYDSTHIVPRGQWENHLEFCTKYQSKLVAEYQQACSTIKTGLPTIEPIFPISSHSAVTTDPGWGYDPDGETFSLMGKFNKMKL